MLQYSTKTWDSWSGWFRTSESDLGQAVPVGALPATLLLRWHQAPLITAANTDSDMFLFYNQIKSVPGFLIEPYYILYSNRYNPGDHSNQRYRYAETLESDSSHGRRPDRDAQRQL